MSAKRAKSGQFLPGVSGNPAGVGKDLAVRRKQEIVVLKENLEYAIRGPGGPLSTDRVVNIVKRMCTLAEQGDIKAARLILALAISPAGNAAEKDDKAVPSITIKVENATFSAVKAVEKTSDTIDGEYTEKQS